MQILSLPLPEIIILLCGKAQVDKHHALAIIDLTQSQLQTCYS
jgi:hypothetical protein